MNRHLEEIVVLSDVRRSTNEGEGPAVLCDTTGRRLSTRPPHLQGLFFPKPSRFATRFSTPSAMTSDCGTLPSAGNVNLSPRHAITLEVKSTSISSPGMIVFSFAATSFENCCRRRLTSSGTSTHRNPLLYALRR